MNLVAARVCAFFFRVLNLIVAVFPLTVNGLVALLIVKVLLLQLNYK